MGKEAGDGSPAAPQAPELLPPHLGRTGPRPGAEQPACWGQDVPDTRLKEVEPAARQALRREERGEPSQEKMQGRSEEVEAGQG